MARNRNGRSADIVRLDIHDWFGRLLHRIKGKTTEPRIGIAIIEAVKNAYNLSDRDIYELQQQELNIIKKETEELKKTNADKLRDKINNPITWKKF